MRFGRVLEDLEVANQRGELVHLVDPAAAVPHHSREEWQELLAWRVPQARLELRAGYLVTRQFLVDYWEQWNPLRRLAG